MQKLSGPTCRYILSSSVGTGKTTFLYWLAVELLVTRSAVPVLMTCSDFKQLNKLDWKDLIKRPVLSLGPFSEIDTEDFYKASLASNKLIFLFDGLDQIPGTDYKKTVEDIINLCGSHPLLVATRPSASLSFEQDNGFFFLKLNDFSFKAQSIYFGDQFEEVREIAIFASDLVRIPMLAYMIKSLPAGLAKTVTSRTGLYDLFIEYIMKRYDTRGKENPELCSKVENFLQYFSFETLKHNALQKVPYKLYENLEGKICTFKDVLSFGLVNHVLEGGEWGQQFLFFNHMSFQEFLAAQHLNKHPKLIEEVLDEKWNPKWKEVIKFLAGLRGEDIIRKVLSQDNVIHSGLFLAAECAPEVMGISYELKNTIITMLIPLTKEYHFLEDTTTAISQLGDQSTISMLITDDYYVNRSIRAAAINSISEVKIKLNDDLIYHITDLVNDYYSNTRNAAKQALSGIKDKLSDDCIAHIKDKLSGEVINRVPIKGDGRDEEILDHVFRTLEDLSERVGNDNIIACVVKHIDHADPSVRKEAILSLSRMSENLCDSDIAKIIARLSDGYERVRHHACWTLRGMNEKLSDDAIDRIVDHLSSYGYKGNRVRINTVLSLEPMMDRLSADAITRIVDLLDDEDGWVRAYAIKSLTNLKEKDKLGDEEITRILDHLDDQEEIARRHAIEALPELKTRLSDDTIARSILNILSDQNPFIRDSAIEAIAALKEKLTDKVIGSIIHLMDDEDKWISADAIEALSKIKDRLGDDTIVHIINCLHVQDKNGYVCNAATKALIAMKEKLSSEAIASLADCVNASEASVRSAGISVLSELKAKLSEMMP